MCKAVVKLCLYGFNAMVFVGCTTVLTVQTLKTSTDLSSIGMASPELLVLSFTLVALWVLSAVGLYGTFRRRGTTLRM